MNKGAGRVLPREGKGAPAPSLDLALCTASTWLFLN